MAATTIRTYVDCPVCDSRQNADVRTLDVSFGPTYDNRNDHWEIGRPDNKFQTHYAVCANHDNADLLAYGTMADKLARTVASGRLGKLVEIKLRKSAGSGRGCGGACINGKISCDCPCEGRCHGANKCYCIGDE